LIDFSAKLIDCGRLQEDFMRKLGDVPSLHTAL